MRCAGKVKIVREGNGWMASTTLGRGAKLILLPRACTLSQSHSHSQLKKQSWLITVAAAVEVGTGTGQNGS